MTDLDTTLKELLNSAVDRELAGRRAAPPLRQDGLPERRRPAGWAAPMLAAMVAALVALGSVAVVGYDRLHHSDHNQARSGGGPVAVNGLGRGTPTTPDPRAAAQAYAQVAAIAPEATEAAGVQVDPVRTAGTPRNSDLVTNFSLPGLLTPGPTITLPPDLVSATPSEGTVLSVRFDNGDGTVGSCPGPFRVRPRHTYLITCTMPSRAVGVARFSLTLQTPTGSWKDGYKLPPT